MTIFFEKGLDPNSCRQEGSPVDACITAILKKSLSEDIQHFNAADDAQVCNKGLDSYLAS